MRDDLNFNVLPIVQDNMNYISFNTAGIRPLTNISTNGYYGYQPTPIEKPKEDPQGDAMDVQFEVQFENCPQQQTRLVNRKRGWEFSNDHLQEFKKRRHNNEFSPLTHHHQQPASSNRDLSLRKPTHNIPDMPRCILGHYM